MGGGAMGISGERRRDGCESDNCAAENFSRKSCLLGISLLLPASLDHSTQQKKGKWKAGQGAPQMQSVNKPIALCRVAEDQNRREALYSRIALYPIKC